MSLVDPGLLELRDEIGFDWLTWCHLLWPDMFSAPLAEHHEDFWDHVFDQLPGEPAMPILLALARGGAKSTTGETAATLSGLLGLRSYVLVVSGTQDASDKHVESMADLLSAPGIATYFPEHADRALTKFGQSKGWRRNRLTTAGGLVIDAAGLDTKIRGLKFEQKRPDFMLLDDLDERDDSERITLRRFDRLTTSVLPAGASDGSTLIAVVQNLVLPHGVMSKLMRAEDGVLKDAKRIGPIPALYGAVYDPEGIPVAGEPSWPGGQDLKTCQQQARLWGPATFLTESQHDFSRRKGALWVANWIRYEPHTADDCILVVVSWDPAAKDRVGSDEHGLIVAGLLPGRRVVILDDLSGHWSIDEAAAKAVALSDFYMADVVYEDNQGGDHIVSTLRVAGATRYRPNTAKGSKVARAYPVAQAYAIGAKRADADPTGETLPLIVHARPFTELEAQLTGWVPARSTDSPDRLDALAWAVHDLVGTATGVTSLMRPVEEANDALSLAMRQTPPALEASVTDLPDAKIIRPAVESSGGLMPPRSSNWWRRR